MAATSGGAVERGFTGRWTIDDGRCGLSSDVHRLSSIVYRPDLAHCHCEVANQVVRVFDAHAQADQVIRHLEGRVCDAGVGHHARVLDKRLHAAQALGQGEQARAFDYALCLFETALDLERDHAAKTAHLSPGEVVLGVRGDAWIAHTLDLGVLYEELGYLAGV